MTNLVVRSGQWSVASGSGSGQKVTESGNVHSGKNCFRNWVSQRYFVQDSFPLSQGIGVFPLLVTSLALLFQRLIKAQAVSPQGKTED